MESYSVPFGLFRYNQMLGSAVTNWKKHTHRIHECQMTETINRKSQISLWDMSTHSDMQLWLKRVLAVMQHNLFSIYPDTSSIILQLRMASNCGGGIHK